MGNDEFSNCEFQPTLGTPFPLPHNFPGFLPGIFPLLTKILNYSPSFFLSFSPPNSAVSRALLGTPPAPSATPQVSFPPGIWDFPLEKGKFGSFGGILVVFLLRNSRKIPGSQRAVEELQAPGEPRLLPGDPEKFQVGAADPRVSFDNFEILF